MQSQHIGNQFSNFLKSGSLLSILFITNVAVWLLMLLMPLVDYLYALPPGSAKAGWYGWLALSSEWDVVLHRPWTLLTYMFLHDGFWHILFNMLMLYFGGTMCCRYLNSRRFGWIYFLSGLVGGLLYLLVYNVFPVGRMQVSTLVGASAAVLGVFVAVAAYLPNQEVSLWLVRTFSIKLKWLAFIFVVVDLLSIPTNNAGGHIAHIGGALFGWFFVVVMRWANNGSVPFGNGKKTSGRRHRALLKSSWKKIFSRPQKSTSSRPLSDEEYNRRRADNQRRVDAILDKISKSGYDNLTKEEKEFLFSQSRREY